MIIPSNALFCLNTKITLNKWKVIAKWKAIGKKKEFFSLTYLQLVGVVKEKKRKWKRSNTSGHYLQPFTQCLFFCVNLARNPLKVSFYFKYQKKMSVYGKKNK